MGLGKFSYLFYLLILLSVTVSAFGSGYRYGTTPNAKGTTGKDFLPGVFGVQGVIYCKSGPKVLPLKGVVVRITCLGIDKYSLEKAPFSLLSRPTDGNGYFVAKLSTQLPEDDGVNILQCKAFLHSCPLKTCNFATDVNGGLSGAPISAYRPIGSNGMRLYSVGPFVYSS